MTSRANDPLIILLVSLSILSGSFPVLPTAGAASPRPLWTFSTPGDLHGSPSVADLDDDGTLETVVSADSLGLVVLDANGSLKWNFSFPSTVVTGPLLADIDSDGRTELVAGTDGGSVHALTPDRTLLWTYTADGAISSDLSAADVNGDRRTEVIFATGAGSVVAVGPDGKEAWKFPSGSTVNACQAAADFFGDGTTGVAVACGNGRLYMIGKGGSSLWNVSTGSPLLADPAVFDLDIDGRPEILTGAANGNVTAFRADGTRLWTFQSGGAVSSSITVADQDGDDRPEVLFGCDDGRLYCLSPEGSLEWTYYCGSPAGPPAPYNAGDRCQVAFPTDDGKLRILGEDRELRMSFNASAVPKSSCAVANLRDRDLPALIINGNDRVVRCFPLGDIPTLEWRTRQHDARRTGAVQASFEGRLPGSLEWLTPLSGSPEGPPAAADVDGDGRAEVAVATANGTLYLLDGSRGSVRWSVDAPGPAMRPSAPLVCDLDGDSRPEVAWAGPDGVLRALWPSNGSGLWSLDLGIYEASPAAGDLDGDGRTELAIGTDSGAFVWVDGTGGAVRWALDLADGVRATAALADLGGGPALEAVVSTAGSLLALRNGTVLWSTSDPVFLPTAPLMGDLNADNTPDVIVGTGRGELRAFSGTDGRPLWNLSLGAAVTEPAAQAILPGANSFGLVATASDGSLVGVSGREGAVLWKVQAGAATSPAVADLDLDGAPEILVGTRTGLDAFTDGGTLLWHFPATGGVPSPPVITDVDRDGSLEVVFGGRDGNMYSLSAGGRCLRGDNPWPQYRHDSRRTGDPRIPDRYLPDLVLVPGSFRLSADFPDEGGAVQVTVNVWNGGVAAAPAFFVSLADNGTMIGSKEAASLEAGHVWQAGFLWDPKGGNHILEALVDARGTVAELREDNNAAGRYVPVNFLPVSVPGGDIRVDLGAVALFDGSASRDPDGEISEHLWSFGDGGTARGIQPTHRYQVFGRFCVTLQVTDDSGATVSGTLNVTVNGPPRIVDRSPNSDVNMAESETRTFTITAADPEGDPFSVLWHLDGGWAGAGTRFAYYPNYSSEGNHVLAAEVSDGSRIIMVVWNITVSDSPSPILSQRPAWRDLTAGFGERVAFGIELSDRSYPVQWFLDGAPVDGATGVAFELATTTASAGRHTVSVMVDASGHEDRRDWLLDVQARNTPPVFDHLEPPGDSVLILSYGTQEFVVAAGDPQGTPISIQWYLGGAAVLNETGLQFVYNDRGGRGHVTVTVVASDGELTAVHNWNVRINAPPTALFTSSRKTVAERSAVAFDASPSFDPDGNITLYRWSFGDGSSLSSNRTAAGHAFAKAGVYLVELRVTDELGATAASTTTIAVGRPLEDVRSPGSGAILALAAVAVLATLRSTLHRRKRAPNQRN